MKEVVELQVIVILIIIAAARSWISIVTHSIPWEGDAGDDFLQHVLLNEQCLESFNSFVGRSHLESLCFIYAVDISTISGFSGGS